MAEAQSEEVKTSLEEYRAIVALVHPGGAKYECEPEWFGLALTKTGLLSTSDQKYWDELICEHGWNIVGPDRIETGRRS